MDDKANADEPTIVAFVCSWCASLAADLAGTGRNTYPAGVRIVKVPCAGRIDPLYVMKALRNGADGVIVFGCHPRDCHHHSGNHLGSRKFALLKNLMTYVGIDERRIKFCWVTASEGTRFADVVNSTVADLVRIGSPNRLTKAGA